MTRPVLPMAALERLLATRPGPVAEAVRRSFADLRPCVRLETARASSVPLRGRLLDRWLRRPPPIPVLPVAASKFGGVPYVEEAVDFGGWQKRS
jgi:hypothetical protein